MLALVFAGDRRVWRTAALCAVPLVALILVYCLRPRPYLTGSDSVEVVTYVAPTPAGVRVCVPDLELPGGTGRVQMQMISRTQERPELRMTLLVGGRSIASRLAPAAVQASRVSTPVFSFPRLPAHPAYAAARLCVRAADLVNWGGTPLTSLPPGGPTMAGRPFPARLALWYLPPAGARSSYVARAGAILERAALFRPGVVGPWLYALLLLVMLPGLALASIRCMALAVAAGGPDGGAAGVSRAGGAAGVGREAGAAGVGREAGVAAVGHEASAPRGGPWGRRRLAAWMFAIAALNFACWALITPPFQAPDEVDHFAYTQSLV